MDNYQKWCAENPILAEIEQLEEIGYNGKITLEEQNRLDNLYAIREKMAELDRAFAESVKLHGAWLQTPEGSAEQAAARMAWIKAHRRYVKAVDDLRAANPQAADAWKPPTRR